MSHCINFNNRKGKKNVNNGQASDVYYCEALLNISITVADAVRRQDYITILKIKHPQFYFRYFLCDQLNCIWHTKKEGAGGGELKLERCYFSNPVLIVLFSTGFLFDPF